MDYEGLGVRFIWKGPEDKGSGLELSTRKAREEAVEGLVAPVRRRAQDTTGAGRKGWHPSGQRRGRSECLGDVQERTE